MGRDGIILIGCDTFVEMLVFSTEVELVSDFSSDLESSVCATVARAAPRQNDAE
jgi:hypothetical protein